MRDGERCANRCACRRLEPRRGGAVEGRYGWGVATPCASPAYRTLDSVVVGRLVFRVMMLVDVPREPSLLALALGVIPLLAALEEPVFAGIVVMADLLGIVARALRV